MLLLTVGMSMTIQWKKSPMLPGHVTGAFLQEDNVNFSLVGGNFSHCSHWPRDAGWGALNALDCSVKIRDLHIMSEVQGPDIYFCIVLGIFYSMEGGGGAIEYALKREGEFIRDI